jgi:hypothetical protein
MTMKKIFILLLYLLVQNICFAQDIIYKKDGTIQKGKILEVTVDRVKYMKIELPNGPTYEILKSEVIKIKYSTGYIDIINPSAIFDNTRYNSSQKKYDSINYSMVYILFNSIQDESLRVPLYLNGKLMHNFHTHQRLALKIYSEGKANIYREFRKQRGPELNFPILNGNFYGIRIEVPYPYAFDPQKKYLINVISDSTAVMNFINNEFFGFNPYPEDDIKIEEDKKNPYF